MAASAIQGFLDELHHYAALTTVPSSEAVATASDLRAFLKEVSDHDLGSSHLVACTFLLLFLTPFPLLRIQACVHRYFLSLLPHC